MKGNLHFPLLILLRPTKAEICTLLSKQFLTTAEKRLSGKEYRTEADLRRATSDLYYALFHRVCEALVAPMGADPDNKAFKETYRSFYRLPNHGRIESRCKDIGKKDFCGGILVFARQVITMKNKRHNADYDPLAIFAVSSVENDLLLTKKAIAGFDASDQVQQSRFAMYVSIQGRKVD